MNRTINVDAAKVSFRVDGSGPGLVLLHGTGGNSDTNWSQLVGRLSESRTVIRPDYSGSGETIDDGRALTVAMLAEQVVAAAEHAGATPFDLVGYSLGASVAIHIAAEFPSLVRSLVSLSGFADAADSRQQMQWELWHDLIREDRKMMARMLLLTGFSPEFLARMKQADVENVIEQIVETNNWDGMARQVELDRTLDVRDQAARITKPALVIGCTYDYMVPPVHSRRIAELIPNARYAEIETGHLSTLERPDQVAEMISNFISSDFPAS